MVVRKTENPVYNEAFVFKVPKEAMAYSSFKILVVNRTSYGRDEALGDITIGPQEYKDGLLHWNKMLMELRKPVAMWHPIIMNWSMKFNWTMFPISDIELDYVSDNWS